MAENCLYAVVLGLALGLLLDIFRFYRLTFNDKFFFDFFYWIISAICIFCYMIIFNNGEIRTGYVLLIFAAIVLYILTIGSLTKKAEICVTKKLKSIVKKIKKQLKSLFNLYYNNREIRKKSKATDDKGEVYDRQNQDEEEQ